MTKSTIASLRNLGKSSEKLLNGIGIFTLDDIEDMGVVEAYAILKAKHEQVSVNMLYALYGAVHDVAWNKIPLNIREELLQAVEEFRFGS